MVTFYGSLKVYIFLTHPVHHISTHKAKKAYLYVEQKTQYGIRSISYAIVCHWNALPLKLRQSASLSNFKTKLRKYLLSKHTLES